MNRLLKEILPYVIILVVVVLIRTFIVTPVTVEGDSMYPNLKEDELLLLSKISYKIRDINRFDIVVIKKDDDEIIKRIIGLPGEDVSYISDKLYINGKEVKDEYGNGDTKDFSLNDICYASYLNKNLTFEQKFECEYTEIPEGYYLVLGDNREISKDSRRFGLVSEDEIIGKAIVRFWPLNRIGTIK